MDPFMDPFMDFMKNVIFHFFVLREKCQKDARFSGKILKSVKTDTNNCKKLTKMTPRVNTTNDTTSKHHQWLHCASIDYTVPPLTPLDQKWLHWTRNDSTGHNWTRNDSTGHNWTRNDSTGPVMTPLDQYWLNRASIDSTGPNSAGNDPTVPEMTWNDRKCWKLTRNDPKMLKIDRKCWKWSENCRKWSEKCGKWSEKCRKWSKNRVVGYPDPYHGVAPGYAPCPPHTITRVPPRAPRWHTTRAPRYTTCLSSRTPFTRLLSVTAPDLTYHLV